VTNLLHKEPENTSMKMRTALFAVVVPSLLAVVGCKSEYEKYADAACACKDSACVKEVGEKHKGMLGGEKTSLEEADKKLKALPEKDQEAFKRGFKCSMDIALADMKKDKGGDK
jgi:hypothetical protein